MSDGASLGVQKPSDVAELGGEDEDEEVVVQMSPTKRCCGIIVYRPNDCQVTKITVLPHFWDKDSNDQAIFERDCIRVPKGLVESLDKQPQADDETEGAQTPGGSDDKEPPKLGDLVSRTFRRANKQPGADPAALSVLLTMAAELDAMTAHLDARAKPRKCVSVRDLEKEWSVQVADVAREVPAVRTYLAIRFLLDLEQQRHALRKGYVYTTEWRTSVRGQLVTAGLIARTARGRPNVQCTFSDHTHDDGANRLLKRALNVALGHIPSEYVDRAATLLRTAFADVGEASTTEALQLARTVRTNRSNRALGPALDLAKALVRSFYTAGVDESDAATRPGVVSVLMIDMARFWELAVIALLKEKNYEVIDQPKLDRRTLFGTLDVGRAADIAMQKDGRLVGIVDCKYKQLDKDPISADLYQIYSYIDLYKQEPQRTGWNSLQTAALVYPLRTDHKSKPIEPKTTCVRHEHLVDGWPALHVIQLPFPKADQTLDEWITWVKSAENNPISRLST